MKLHWHQLKKNHKKKLNKEINKLKKIRIWDYFHQIVLKNLKIIIKII